jgi:hypothetical protein
VDAGKPGFVGAVSALKYLVLPALLAASLLYLVQSEAASEEPYAFQVRGKRVEQRDESYSTNLQSVFHTCTILLAKNGRIYCQNSMTWSRNDVTTVTS